MAAVGTVGLASALASGVVERTREIGVRKTLGATPARIAALFVSEALYVSAMSWPLAVLLSLPFGCSGCAGAGGHGSLLVAIAGTLLVRSRRRAGWRS